MWKRRLKRGREDRGLETDENRPDPAVPLPSAAAREQQGYLQVFCRGDCPLLPQEVDCQLAGADQRQWARKTEIASRPPSLRFAPPASENGRDQGWRRFWPSGATLGTLNRILWRRHPDFHSGRPARPWQPLAAVRLGPAPTRAAAVASASGHRQVLAGGSNPPFEPKGCPKLAPTKDAHLNKGSTAVLNRQSNAPPSPTGPSSLPRGRTA